MNSTIVILQRKLGLPFRCGDTYLTGISVSAAQLLAWPFHVHHAVVALDCMSVEGSSRSKQAGMAIDPWTPGFCSERFRSAYSELQRANTLGHRSSWLYRNNYSAKDSKVGHNMYFPRKGNNVSQNIYVARLITYQRFKKKIKNKQRQNQKHGGHIFNGANWSYFMASGVSAPSVRRSGNYRDEKVYLCSHSNASFASFPHWCCLNLLH